MNETSRTLTFVAVAAVSLVAASLLAPSVPRQPSEFAEVGKSFYPDFDALAAKSLEVVTYNEDTATAKTFRVEFKDGKWRIASHLNYPADGKDRLARTAASMIGIQREQYRTNNVDDYPELGVIDPKDTDVSKLKGRGERITVKDGNGKVLADYIIGKQLADRPGYYYVRKPDERSVYIARLDNIDISTKFTDWIEADLLQVQPDHLREVVINNYSIDEARGRIVGEEVNRLTREKAADPWKLDGQKDDSKEIDTSKVDTLVNTLDDLRIIGVRPKPPGLSEDLKLDKGIDLNNVPTLLDLQSHGFVFTRDGELKSNEGEVIAATSEGVVYALRFGEVFAGTETELETGLEAAKKESEKNKEGGEEGNDSQSTSGRTEGRYLFVTAHFNERHLGPQPEKPVKPEPSAPADEAADKATPADKKSDADAKSEAAEETPKKSEAADADKPADAESSDAAADSKADEAKAESNDEKSEKDAKSESRPDPAEEAYQAALKKYEEDLKAYDEKVKAGKEKVEELNRRFADWYYVISADSFNKLRLSRSELLKDKDKSENDSAASPETPATSPEKTSEPSATESPEASKSPAAEKVTPSATDSAKPDSPAEAGKSDTAADAPVKESKEASPVKEEAKPAAPAAETPSAASPPEKPAAESKEETPPQDGQAE